jgi:methylmalonyl-CoA/ethylmalonyl-CoA epimerase
VFKKLIQVGIVTKDIKKIVKNYNEIYKIGPWYMINFSAKNVDSMTLYGKRQDYSMDLAVCPIGKIRFEYINPVSSSIYEDFYEKYGEGVVHHLKLDVNDTKTTLNSIKEKGVDMIQSGNQLGDSGENQYYYVDTQKKLGFITEIVNITKDFIKPQPEYWYPSEDYIPDPIFAGVSMIGIVVKNLEEKIKNYSVFGIGPWEIYDFTKGEGIAFSIKMALCRINNVIIKLIMPVSDSVFSEYLIKYGEGIHHLKMEVTDYKRTLNYLESKGAAIINSGIYDDIHFSFLDTREHLNFITEISDKNLFSENNSKIILHP